MQIPKAELKMIIQGISFDLLNDKEKITLALAIAYTHSDLDSEKLLAIAKELLLEKEALLSFICGSGKVDLLHAHVGQVEVNYEFFQFAAQHGQLEIMERLIELLPHAVQEMIAANDYRAFALAAENGHLAVLEFIMKLAPDKIEAMIAANHYEAIHEALRNNHFSIINCLLPFSLPFAETTESGTFALDYLIPFILQKIIALRDQKIVFEQVNPGLIFNLDHPEEIKQCLSLARILIRLSNPTFSKYLLLLLDIPVVKSVVQSEEEEMDNFFNDYLEKKIGTVSLSPYPLDKDGGVNPALKIFGTKYEKNKMDNDRWEIFILLKNEEGKVGMRSGIKSETGDYKHLNVAQQFDFSLFSKPLTGKITQCLSAYRRGHPSLALDFSALIHQHYHYRTLPVFTGGWLLRNDGPEDLRIQVYWSSGRFGRDFTPEELHLLQLCVAFYVMREYGKDFNVEFFSYYSTNMETFITKKASGGMNYKWGYVVKEVSRLIADEAKEYHASNFFLSSV